MEGKVDKADKEEKANKEDKANKEGGFRGTKLFAVLGIFFGLGFTLGFLTGFGHSQSKTTTTAAEVPAIYQSQNARAAPSEDAAPRTAHVPTSRDEPPPPPLPIKDIELILEEHSLGEDENGLFISGIVVNHSDHPFDAVRIAFDLYDEDDVAYASLTDRAIERMEPGDNWGFTIYVPYTDAARLSDYRLQSILGIRK